MHVRPGQPLMDVSNSRMKKVRGQTYPSGLLIVALKGGRHLQQDQLLHNENRGAAYIEMYHIATGWSIYAHTIAQKSINLPSSRTGSLTRMRQLQLKAPPGLVRA